MGLSKCITAYCACASWAALLGRTPFRQGDEVGVATRATRAIGVRYQAPAGDNRQKNTLTDSSGLHAQEMSGISGKENEFAIWMR